MPKNRIALVHVWMGPIPEYFKYHHRTCLDQRVDFFMFTDQDLGPEYDAPNFKVIKLTMDDLIARLKARTGKDFLFRSNYKVAEVKPSYPDIFSDYVGEYEYVGWYDIDTLFGDIASWVEPYLGEYIAITQGEVGLYYRMSGPFTMIRNLPEIRGIYKYDPNFYSCMEKEEYAEYDERLINERFVSLGLPIKVITDASNLDPVSNVIGFDAVWSGGKLFMNGREKLIHHFYQKGETKLEFRGNSIVSHQKVRYEEDFTWITYFTENYEPLARMFVKSLEKYSSRRCVLYTVNYESSLQYELSDQFIVRRIDIAREGDWLDDRGRSFNTITSKPIILADSLRAFPGRRFVFLDTDVYCTASIDCVSRKFDELENYPLTNSHVHDVIYIVKDGEYISSLHALAEEMGFEVNVFPRRKTNVMLYDERSAWFFDEQMRIYRDYKHSKRPFIFAFHDEDTFNAILCRDGLKKALPVVDLEEVHNMDIKKFASYRYNYTPVSGEATFPKSDREVYVFHGFKKPEDFERIEREYCSTVLDRNDVLVKYNGKDLVFTRNSMLYDKKVGDIVTIRVKWKENLYFECDWVIRDSKYFFVWDLYMQPGRQYEIEISERGTDRLLFHRDLTIS